MIDTAAAATFAALGTTASVLVASPDVLEEATSILRSELDDLDRACSRFRPDSELAAVNDAAGQPVAVSPLLLEAVEVAVRAARVTGGLVDPTVGAAMSAIGYDRDFSQVAPAGPALRVELRPVPGWRRIRVERRTSTVQIPTGAQLDLGATAKAFGADRAAAAVAARCRSGVLVNLGGDLAIAGRAPAGGWRVRVADDHAAAAVDDPAAAAAAADDPAAAERPTVAVRSGGLATSSTSVRRWARGGMWMHHLVDPSTGRPAPEWWRTVSVAAGSCVDANIASTASVILGPSAPAWLADRRLPARLVDATGAVTVVAGWPADGAETVCS